MERKSISIAIFAMMISPAGLYGADTTDFGNWVQRLGHPRYVIREAADRKLRKAGLAAADTVARGMNSDDAEISRRCDRIFTHIVQTEKTKSRMILRRVAARDSTRAARRAQSLLDSKSIEVTVNAYVDILVTVDEAPAGSFLLGAGINADAGLVGSIVVEPPPISRDIRDSPPVHSTILDSIRTWLSR